MKEIIMRYQNGELAFTDIIPYFEKMIFQIVSKHIIKI